MGTVKRREQRKEGKTMVKIGDIRKVLKQDMELQIVSEGDRELLSCDAVKDTSHYWDIFPVYDNTLMYDGDRGIWFVELRTI